jgi:wyosine [tRNA(Phe)-imidazoG37] synthetase (radical SAM superfamily)
MQFSNWINKKLKNLSDKIEDDILLDKNLSCRAVYGPVQSRRLGTVLGINNVKPKVCSYNCRYCSSGETSCVTCCSEMCFSPHELYISVNKKLDELYKSGKKVDYILFSGSGEPTLDKELAQEILLLRRLGIKIAVFTNSSLLWNPRIQENLAFADFVSMKVDTVNGDLWTKINRPHKRINYDKVLDGIKSFAVNFTGTLTTETMLLKGYNDNNAEIKGTGDYLNSFNHSVSYFNIPFYPVNMECSICPDTKNIKNLALIIKNYVDNSELLCCPEDKEFIITNDFSNELIGLLTLHPVSSESVRSYAVVNGNSGILENMFGKDIIKEISFGDKDYLFLNAKENLYNL